MVPLLSTRLRIDPAPSLRLGRAALGSTGLGWRGMWWPFGRDGGGRAGRGGRYRVGCSAGPVASGPAYRLRRERALVGVVVDRDGRDECSGRVERRVGRVARRADE